MHRMNTKYVAERGQILLFWYELRDRRHSFSFEVIWYDLSFPGILEIHSTQVVRVH